MLGAPAGIPNVPPGSTGVSNNHAIRISSFTVCVGTLSIGDTVFTDLDGDGTQDPGEPGIGNVTVDLKDPDGNLIATTTTQPDGSYEFTQLPPNASPTDPFAYVVDPDESTLPAGTTWTPTGDQFGGDTTEDGVSTVPLTPTSGSVTTANFAYQPSPATISGHVWSDPEDNGVVGTQDTELDGVTIELVDAGGNVVATTTTVNGAYSFTNLLPGTYTIRETQPATYANGATVPGTNGAGSTTDDEIVVTIDYGETSTDNDFFEVPGASIAGTVFEDPDDDGLQEGAPGIGGVTMTLTGTDDDGNAVTRTTTTSTTPGSIGDYSFGNLRPGTYTVTEGATPGFGDGQDTLGSIGGNDAVNDVFSNIVLGANVAAIDYDFAELPNPSLAGTVLDENGAPIQGVVITVDDGAGFTATATTLADGTYSFPSLPPGTYTVTETQPTGYGDVSTTAGSEGGVDTVENVICGITLALDDVATGYDFVEGFSSIAGTVYEDDNNNGVQDGSEVGIGGADVTLTGTDDRGNVINTTISTKPDGTYLFDDLFSGPYTITEVTPPGYLDGTDAAGSTGGTATNPGDVISGVSLAAGEDATDYDFGEIKPGSIAGTVLDDLGRPIPNVDITLTGTDDRGTITSVVVQTDVNGNYIFPNLRPGTYTVTETQPPAYGDGSDEIGSVGGTSPANDVLTAIVLGQGVDAVDYDFNETTATISGSVQEFGGAFDGDPIGGVTIRLVNAFGVEVATTVTLPDGTYEFTGLLAGNYTVTEDQPAAYGDGTDTPGAAGGTATNPGDEIATIPLAAGGSAPDNDFTEIRSSISGHVFVDAGDNGAYDALFDPPLGGIDVTLTGTDVLGNIITPITIQTQADGSYLFPDLLAGTYTVTEGPVANYADGKDGLGSSGGTLGNDVLSAIPLAGGVDAVNYDFGERPAASISGNVSAERADGSSVVVPGVTITLTGTDVVGNPVSLTTTTDAFGNYSFDSLIAGTYTVTETQPAGYGEQSASPGSVGGTASGTNVINSITLTGIAVAEDYDFVEDYASIAGTVYEDDNNNGVQDPGEAGIPNATVTLTGTDPSGAIVSVVVQTGPLGEYLFTDLLGGTYTVTEVTPTGYLDGTDANGSTGGSATNPGDAITSISLAPDEDATDHDFGEIIAGSISGSVTDENGDPIGGVTITLTGTDDLGAITPIVITTNPDGSYVFPNLRPGTYTVTETQPAGFGEGGQTTPDGGATTALNVISGLTVGQGTSNIDNDFVETYSSIAGHVFVDVNDNGEYDLGVDVPLAGQTVTLTGTDPSGAVGPVTATTNALGEYLFADLLAGTYSLAETQPAAYTDGLDSVGSVGGTLGNDLITAIPLPAGTDAVVYDFGETPAAGISGNVSDENGAPIPGVTLTLTGVDQFGTPVAPVAVTTDVNGNYVFPNLAPGTYTVTETQPPGYADVSTTAGSAGGTATVPNVISGIVLGPVTVAIDYDFVEGYSSIAGTVYVDLNDNGVQDAGEPGIAGVDVTLNGTNPAGAITPITVMTDADGNYLFDDLRAGTYAVTEPVQPAGLLDGTDVEGSASGTPVNPGDAINSIVLGVDVDAAGYDFGEIRPASIAGTVTDENGTPIPGVSLTLTGVDDLGNTIAPIVVVTDVNGNYVFPTLRPGTYTVTETQPAGYGNGTQTSPTGNPSGVNVISSITLIAGQSAPDNDFVETFSSIAGTVYADTNNNGVQDAGEPGIVGASVTLTGTDPNGAITPIIVTTGPGGSYLFADLLSGDYTVTESTPTGYLDGTDVAGSTGGTAVNPGDVINGISLSIGEDATDYDFGEIIAGSISGSVTDENGDPIGGVTITLTGTDDLGAITPIVITTNPDGSYVFPNLRPGTYTVTESQPAGFGEGGQTTPDGGATTALNVISGLTVGQGTSNIDNDFVETYSSIAGTVYVDVNDNGIQDAGEPGIAGASVTLNGTDPNGAITAVTLTTGANGSYLFADLLAGDYVVTEATPPAFDDGTDVAGSVGGTAVNPGDEINSITLPAGTDSVDYDFGEIGTVLSGTVYLDDDRDGVIDATETVRLGGVTIILQDADGKEVARTTTAPDGTYSFVGLAAGDYTVVQVQPGAYGTTTVNTVDVTVPKAGRTGVDFGEDLGSIGNFVFRDSNGNGIQDAGEAGVAGVKVQLLDPLGTVIGEVTTGVDGGYLFDRLAPGSYTVKFVPADGDFLTVPGRGDAATGSDPDWVTGTTSLVTLAVDAGTGLVDRRTDVDAGIVPEVIDLAITAAIDKTTVKLGDVVTYTFTPTNNGPVPVLDGAKVVLSLPPLVRINQVIAPGWTVTTIGNEVTLVLDRVLLPGEPLPPITVATTVVSAAGSPAATARIGTVNSEGETTLANNSATVSLGIITVNLPVTGSNITRLLMQYGAFLFLVGAALGLLGRRKKGAVITG